MSAVAAIPVCPGCGVIAPRQQTRCALCGTSFGETPSFAPGGAGESMFAQLRLDVTCGACGAETPDWSLGQQVACERCGEAQTVRSALWTGALNMAHAVADLCTGRGPATSNNPYHSVGNKRLFLDRRFSTVHAQASPGHPLCTTCHVPLEVGRDGAGGVYLQCPGCSARVSSELPESADFVAPMLQALIRHRHDSDAVAMRCPECGGSLDITPGNDFSTCPFCNTTSRIEQRTAPESVWALFAGPSPDRVEMEKKAAEARRAAEAKRKRPLVWEGEAEYLEHYDPDEERWQSEHKNDGLYLGVMLVGATLVVIFVLGIAYC